MILINFINYEVLVDIWVNLCYFSALVSVSSTSNTPVSSILIDPREDLRKRDKKIEEQMKSSLVETALSMGFEASLVQKALKRLV